MNNVLLIAYHFPPYAGGSGVHRAASFYKYLPENGWSAHVLTVNRAAYEEPQAPRETTRPPAVTRALALDARRHLSFKNRYFKWTAMPDRWVSWAIAAVPAGLYLAYRNKADAILVTYPIATAVLIGLILQRLTRLPLVVDFRDSMTEDEYPRDPSVRSVYRRLERDAIARGSHYIFTAESARTMYLDRYPQLAPDTCSVIPNGYDEEFFAGLGHSARPSLQGRPFRMVHAGLIYPEERDPRPLFRAISRLKKDGTISAATLNVELRASGSEAYYSRLLRELDVQDIVHLLPAIPYTAVLEDMAAADGLLLLQAANCNHQIPAKAYEYLRLARPMLALTAHEGDTAALFRQTGGATILDLADEEAIYRGLPEFINGVINGRHVLPSEEDVRHFSRRQQTAVLARTLSQVIRQVPRREAVSQAGKSIRMDERPLK